MIKAQPITAITKAEAQSLTDRIKGAVGGLSALVEQAHDRKAWKAMGYATWNAYVAAEFGFTKQRSFQLLDQGKVAKAINEAIGQESTTVDFSERETRDIKPVLAEVTADIKQRIEQGEKPDAAAADAIKAAREKAKADRDAQKAAKDAEQAKNKAFSDETRAKFSTDVQARMEARKPSSPVDDGGLSDAERIAELEETVAILERENAGLKAEIKLFGDMKAEYEKGGFAEVIAGKDEVIRVQATRIERESHDKAGWKRSSDMWRKRAEESGWSNDILIDVDTGEVVNG